MTRTIPIILICCALSTSCSDSVIDTEPSQHWQFRTTPQTLNFAKHTDGCLEYQLSIDFEIPNQPFQMKLTATIINLCDYAVHVPLSIHDGQLKHPPFVLQFNNLLENQSTTMLCHRWVFHTDTQDIKPKPKDVSSPIKPKEQLTYTEQFGWNELIQQDLKPLGIEYTPLNIRDINNALIHWPKSAQEPNPGRITERDACADQGLPVPEHEPWKPEKYSIQKINSLHFPESVLDVFAKN